MTEVITGETQQKKLRDAVEKSPLGDVDLPKDLLDFVWFRKFESTNPLVTDTKCVHGIWPSQVIEHHRLGLIADDGCIVDLMGELEGEVAITESGDILSAFEADNREEQTGRSLARFSSFAFKLKKIQKTDGPARNRDLAQTYEQQRLEGETRVLSVIEEGFKKAIGGNNSEGPKETDVIEFLGTLTPDQRLGMLQAAEDEIADSEEEASE